MPAALPPPVGSTDPGDLYVDLQTRSLWLGVDPAVDAAESVKISDIVYTQELIDAAEAAANSYTDTRIATRAPTSHTHTSSQITDFAAAVTNVVGDIPEVQWVTGMIVLWSGSLASIGVGNLVGWALCDGSLGTPDLRDRFIIGAGNKAVGSVNPKTTATSSAAGSHTHTINATTLTAAQIPSHTHTVSGTAASAGAHTHSGSTDVQGSHQHTYTTNSDTDKVEVYTGPASIPQAMFTPANGVTSVGGAHSHNVSTVSAGAHTHTVSGTTGAAGSGGSHTHTESTAPTHTHTLSQAEIRDTLPYYALAYIMKL